MEDLTGEYIDRYRITGLLGTGGMAVVYRAHDGRLERDVAIKLIRRSAFPPEMLEQILRRFEREAKSLARLSHPNILKVYDYGEYQGSPYLVLEYQPAENLEARLKDQAMPWRDAVRLIIPVARALEFSHKSGIIHRDIKPSNILFTTSGEPLLSDFGIAKVLNSEGVSATLTGTGVGIGTPAYMAPEQWLGETSELSDQYSLAVVLYQAVTGRIPFESDTPAGIIIKQTTEGLPSPRKYVPDLPETVEAVLTRALSRDPKDRFPSITEFIDALDDLLTGRVEPTKVVPPPVVTAAPTIAASKGELAEAMGLATGAAHAEPEPVEPLPLQPEPVRPLPVEPQPVEPRPVPIVPYPDIPAERRRGARWGLIAGIAVVALLCLTALGGGGLAYRYFTGAASRAPTPTGAIAATSPSPNVPPTAPPTQASSPTVVETPTPAGTPVPTEPFDVDPSGGQIPMQLVPAGDFLMGGEAESAMSECQKFTTKCFTRDFVDEEPAHTVFLDAFYIDRFELTNALYKACVDAGVCPPPKSIASETRPSYYGNPEFDNYPVVWVDWNAADTYCSWRGARLPTEAEWEKAARGPDGRTYPWGEGLDCTRANFYGCVGDTAAAGSYEAGQSPYGVYELGGNVWEWVADFYSATYYAESPDSNPPGPEAGSQKITRSGAWSSEAPVRAARRIGRGPQSPGPVVGFRCARTTLP